MIVIMIMTYLGRWQEAEERFKESLKLSPDQPTTYNNLGKYRCTSMYSPRCVWILYIWSPIYALTASLYGEMKMFSESEEMFRKAIELNPTYAEAYFNLG